MPPKSVLCMHHDQNWYMVKEAAVAKSCTELVASTDFQKFPIASWRVLNLRGAIMATALPMIKLTVSGCKVGQQ